MAQDPSGNSQQNLTSIINTLIIDNDTQQVTPAVVRQVLIAIAASIPVSTNPDALTALAPLYLDQFTGNLSLNQDELAEIASGNLQSVTDGAGNNITTNPIEVPELILTDSSGFSANTSIINEFGNVVIKDSLSANQYAVFDYGQGRLVLSKIGVESLALWSPLSGNADVIFPATTTQESVAYQSYVDNKVVGLLNLRGNHDASTNIFPSTGGSGVAGAILKGDLWYVSVAGVLNGNYVNIGDSFYALNDSPSSSQWEFLEANITYVPEDVANKGTILGNETSTTIYAYAKGVVDYIASLGYQTASMVSSLITSALASFKTTEYLDATSSIQGQLNSRIEYLLNCNVIGTYYSGASNKCLYFILIPANTLNSLDTIEFETRVEKIGTNGSCTIGLYITTTAPTLGSTLSGGVSIALVGVFAAGSNMMPLKREFVVRGSNLRGITLSNNSTTDESLSALGTTANQSTDFAFDRTIDNYISVYIPTANASDTFAKHRFQITRMKNKTTI